MEVIKKERCDNMMSGYEKPEYCLRQIIRDYMFRKSKGLDMTEKQKETKIDNIKVAVGKYFSLEQMQETERLIRNFYEYVSEPEVDKCIKNGEVTEQYLLDLFTKKDVREQGKIRQKETDERSKILSMRDDRIITSEENGNKKIHYSVITYGVLHSCDDSIGRKITIQRIGRLLYMHSINIEDYISKYRVQIQDGDGTINIDVYSNIIQSQMEEEEYRTAILRGLLGSTNLEKLSVNGYIGDIEKREEQEGEAKTSEKADKRERTYRLNSNYVLRYSAEALTAVSIHEEEKRKSNLIYLSDNRKEKNNHGEAR